MSSFARFAFLRRCSGKLCGSNFFFLLPQAHADGRREKRTMKNQQYFSLITFHFSFSLRFNDSVTSKGELKTEWGRYEVDGLLFSI
jgi:hypothetical protein